SSAEPPVIVRPLRVTETPECTVKTLKDAGETALRATVRTLAPGPSMEMSAARAGRALARGMVPVTPGADVRGGEGSVLVLACVIPSRSDPGPVSLVFWTTKLDGVSRSSRASTRSRTGFLRERGGRANSLPIQERAVMGNLLPKRGGLRYHGRTTSR